MCNRPKCSLCGIASNLRDQSPARRRSANGHDPQELGIPDEGQFDLFNDLFQQRRFAKARDLAVTAVSTTPEDASWNYRLAQCYEELGETGKAAKCYQTACDLDPCRYRAPSELRKITRDIAAEFGPSVHFLDLAEAFAAHSNFPAPGEDLFLEHVHFTQEGHWFAAICVARCLVQQVFSLEWNEEAVPTDSDRDEWLGILPEDHLVATVLAFFMGQRPPFRFAVDQPRHQSRLAAKIESIANQLSPIQRDDFMSLSHRAKMDDLVDSLGRQQLARGRLEAALRLFNLSTRRRPWMPNGYVFSAICEHRLGRENLAKDAIEQSRRTPVAETPALLRDRQRLESQMKTRN